MKHLEIGKKYLTRDGREAIVKSIDSYGVATTHWGSKVWSDSGEVSRCLKSDGDLVRLVSDSPVREVTRREIVPGVYGKVCVNECGKGGGIESIEMMRTRSSEELREAAHILNQIAEALEDV